MIIVRPDEMWTLNGAVSGTVETGYQEIHLVDGLPGRPVRGVAGGNLSLTITNPSKEVGIIAVINHNVDLNKNISITGTVSATLVAAVAGGDGIPEQPWKEVTPTNVTTMTVAVTGNSVPVVMGEVVAGKKRTLPDPLAGSQWNPLISGIIPPGRAGAVQTRDRGQREQTVNFELNLSAAELADLQAWYEAQRGTSKPSLVIWFDDVNDAVLGRLVNYSYRRLEGRFFVSLTFEEYARTRW
jgi:hypothetical protein